ncbi:MULTISPECIES: restriction endonuclease subunit S [unclassified Pseudoalteromonas]|jgi:restriction endonuclease S subunit|uniref:restriction endonuclease subunit S n=1 Tax=unclassified Pseudoalteromonas TaxID=194690 RepID=UPI000417A81D|nr:MULTISPECIES: restriction endonuclease subunit S [unclassified Pseudoalteromonas]MDC9499237.1 restriction endonuclease subunit S [Pseudoalteromonas sp. Angola-20]MDC9518917.1 restriction endonuclease subunit S [Pseudoalteromonas sp. Angola-22]MDC9535338.1 restriction endonuclease subunit S [Pseudoalteromonas sp. Angola-9]TMP77639.1 redox-sensing transcriptional repressor Rex [Pseudoalteromonas sp. S983]
MKTIELLCNELTTGATNALFEKNENNAEGALHLLTGSSVNLNGEIIEQQLGQVIIKEGKDVQRFLLKEGDVVLLAKGNSIKAGYVTKAIAELNVIASANFILLRPNNNELLGEVLVAYFNSPAGQNMLDATSTGATIKNINLSNIKKMEIELPVLGKQHKIAELFNASNQAYQTTIKLAEQQKKVAAACISQLMKGAA